MVKIVKFYRWLKSGTTKLISNVLTKMCKLGCLHHSSIGVSQINKTSNNTIHTYGSIKEAQRETGVDKSTIIRVCKGRQNTAGGFKWKYTNEQR